MRFLALRLCMVACFVSLHTATIEAQEHSLDDSLAGARTLLAQGKLHDAESLVRAYISEHRTSADGHYLLAYILFRKDQPVPSLNEYTIAAHLQMPTAQQLSFVARDYVLVDDLADADKWMTKVTEWTPDDSEAWYSLGRIKYSENRFQESVDCFKKALALMPRMVKAENNLGLAYEGLNQVDAAVAAYRSAIAWQADAASPSEQPLVNLGSVLVDRNELGEALPLLKQAAQIAPGDARIHAALGRLYQRQDQLSAAQAELERAVSLAPKTAAYHFLLGQVYRRAGLSEQAKVQFAQAAALDTSQPPH